jgi:hypothetical protein
MQTEKQGTFLSRITPYLPNFLKTAEKAKPAPQTEENRETLSTQRPLTRDSARATEDILKTKEALGERGERLGTVADKTEVMSNKANIFGKNSLKLRQQQQENLDNLNLTAMVSDGAAMVSRGLTRASELLYGKGKGGKSKRKFRKNKRNTRSKK